MSEVKRTNTFILEDCPALRELADSCARLYNELNFERRQAYIHYRRFEWYPKYLYEKYAPLIGSAIAQQIINKNHEAWKSFLALKKLEAKGKLPEHIKKVSMPRYWKRNGNRELRIIIRKDCYRIDDEYIYLPKGLRLRYKGKLKWKGKQGKLEIVYDDVDEVWRGFMAVEVEKPPTRGGKKPLYIDLGVINLATVWFESLKQPIAFSGRTVLSDWWYWTGKIAEEQSMLARVNRAKTSKKLRKLYRIRRRRFSHAVNAMIKTIVEFAVKLGISKIILGRGRLFKCLCCGLEANRDAVGVLNIGHLHGGGVNGVVAHPLLLRWNGMRWEPRRAMNNQPMNALEARISRLQPRRVSNHEIRKRKGLLKWLATIDYSEVKNAY